MTPFNFDNTYLHLNEVFYAEVRPEIPPKPELVLYNEDLANELNLDFSSLDRLNLAEILSGFKLPEGAQPLAMAYAGHQFGHFTMLGDGRAILLGEHVNSKNQRFDIQLKGSGRTPFSRGGDGLATLRAMLREYLMSECMHALGVPSSRSLAVVKTGKPVKRETIHEGAVLTRIMESHLRVGTFEYARQFLNIEEQRELLKYSIQKHFPEVQNSENPALEFLKAVANKQLELIIHWMRIGFIHGVMNTDNMHIGGQTFDYGPCAFMNSYDPKTAFSSIDRNGRYAYGNQPETALWNLSVLAGSVLPQIHTNEEQGIELARGVLNDFAQNFRIESAQMHSAKIGFNTATNESKILTERLFDWMLENKADFTNTFLVLAEDLSEEMIPINDELKHWIIDWKKEIQKNSSWSEAKTLMNRMNPVVIPRNDKVEHALDQAVHQNDYTALHEIVEVIKNPNSTKTSNYQSVTNKFDEGYQTFCGT